MQSDFEFLGFHRVKGRIIISKQMGKFVMIPSRFPLFIAKNSRTIFQTHCPKPFDFELLNMINTVSFG